MSRRNHIKRAKIMRSFWKFDNLSGSEVVEYQRMIKFGGLRSKEMKRWNMCCAVRGGCRR